MLLLLNLAFFSLLAFAASDCDTEYAALLKAKPAAATLSPSTLALPSSPEDLSAGFALAADSWSSAFKPELLKRRFIRLQNDPSALTDHSEWFTDLAQRALVLKQSHEALGSKGAPASLKKFLAVLDNLTAAATKRAAPAEVKNLGLAGEKELANFLAASDAQNFSPATSELLRNRAKALATNIRASTGEDLPTPKKLGNIAHGVSEMLTFARIEQSLRPSAAAKKQFEYLLNLESDLNKIHGDFAEQAKAGEIDYQRQRFFLNPLLRERLENLARLITSSSGAPRK